MTDRTDLNPVRISLTRGAPGRAMDHSPTSGRPFCRPCHLTLFRYFRHPSSDQMVHIGWGRKAEAAKLALPANPFQTE